MRIALQEDQFIVHYQPRVEAKSGKIVAAEALIRWNHPEWGTVSPGEFIPLAEESGLIIEIGDWVIERVCQQIAEWKENGIPVVPVSVNVSANRFLKNNLTATLQSSLLANNVDPSLIEVEITESTLIQYMETVFSTLDQLRDMGIKLVLDDFGTGYSSLTYLKKFKFDTLKIDRSFIQNIDSNEEDAAITSNLISLARDLNMTVVAEGVEQVSQLSLLKKKNCDQIQGFLFSKPIGDEEFAAKLLEKTLKPFVQKKQNPYKSMRKFFRISFQYPLSADMTIVKINQKKVKLGKTEVLIENMGPGGLRFATTMNLPTRKDIILEMETELLGQPVRLQGTIVWKEELGSDVSQYGFEYKMDQQDVDKLVPLLNKLQIQLRKKEIEPNGRFLPVEVEDHFNR